MHRPDALLICLTLAVLLLPVTIAGAQSAPPSVADETGEASSAPTLRFETWEPGLVEAPVAAPQPLADCTPCRAYVIRLDGEVESALRHVISRGIAEAEAGGYHILVIDMDTYGGLLFAAIEIAEALTDADLPTATFVNKKAISAGALISFGTRYIGMVEGGLIGASTPISAGPEEMPQAVEEKINSVVRAQFRALAERNDHPAEIAEAMVDRRKSIPGLVGDDELLTMTTHQALEWGLAVVQANDLDGFLRGLGAGRVSITRLAITPYERIARFLASSTVAGLLMTVGLLCLFIEARTPGVGVPGAIAAVCFLLFFFGNYIARLSGFAPLILVVLGLVLVALEIFVTPGFGVLGGLGLVSLIAGLLLSLVEVPVTSQYFTLAALKEPTAVVATSLVAFAGLAWLVMVLAPRAASITRLTLATVADSAQGYVSTVPGEGVTVGQTGVTLSPLRPAGMAEIAGRSVDVVSSGAFVPRGERVRVIGIEGRRIVVEPVES